MGGVGEEKCSRAKDFNRTSIHLDMPDSVYRHKHVFNSKLFLKLMILVFIVSLVYVHTYNLIRVVMQVS